LRRQKSLRPAKVDVDLPMLSRPSQLSFAAGAFVLAAVCFAGCRSADVGGHAASPSAQATVSPATTSTPAIDRSAPQGAAADVVPATFRTVENGGAPLAPPPPGTGDNCDDDPFAGQTQLDPDILVAVVRERNPSLAAMSAAWQAAAERYPQAVSLEDPQLTLAMGPGTFGDPTHDVAWMVEGSQKLPWPGKRDLRGQKAQAEASAARLDLDDAEVRLVAATRTALWDYYLVRRQEELNAENRVAVGHFRDTAQSKYRANQVTQQDVLEADVELAEIERRQFELSRMDTVAVARINTLLHRAADHLLPPPPSRPPAAPPSIAWLQQFAAERRPDLASIGAQLRAELAAVDLAQRDYYPDLDVVARYDAFWQGTDKQLAPMVGVNMNVPLDNARRQAAIREASARVEQRRWEYESRLDEIHSEVQTAYAQLIETDKVLAVYRQTILPAARQYADSAQGNYTANTLDFLHLIDAQRRLIGVREQYEGALAERERRWAELQRAAGGSWPSGASPEAIPAPPGS
jgi:outer membrane protein TolC